MHGVIHHVAGGPQKPISQKFLVFLTFLSQNLLHIFVF